MTFLLRGFNEYLFNTALIAVLLPLLGRIVVSLHASAPLRKSKSASASRCLRWAHHVSSLGLSRHPDGGLLPGDTLTEHFLGDQQLSHQLVDRVWRERDRGILEKEKRPGVLFVDTQWGNPGTALAVYGKERFPNLRIQPFTREFLDSAETQKIREIVLKLKPAHFAIHSADSSGERDCVADQRPRTYVRYAA